MVLLEFDSDGDDHHTGDDRDYDDDLDGDDDDDDMHGQYGNLCSEEH